MTRIPVPVYKHHEVLCRTVYCLRWGGILDRWMKDPNVSASVACSFLSAQRVLLVTIRTGDWRIPRRC